MRLHNVYLLIIDDGEEYEAYEMEDEAKDRLIYLARESRENHDDELSEMEEQLIRSQGFFMEDPQLEIVFIK